MREEAGGVSSIREVRNYKGLLSVSVISPAVSASWQVRILSFPQRLGGPDFLFQRNGFWVLEKDTPEL